MGMNETKLLVVGCLLAAMAIGPVTAWAADPAPAASLTPAGQKLLVRYTDRLTALRAEIVKSVPKIAPAEAAAFMKVYAGEGTAQSASSDIAATYESVEKARAASLAAARPLLAKAAPFLANDKLDAKLIRCAVLADATPRGLAAFAQQGEDAEALIEKLLADDGLMLEMLEADGAKGGNFGRAMQIYTAIRAASARTDKGILHRLALGTALEHAVPVAQRNREDRPNEPTIVDPVKRYMHYEKAYLNGELDPAFGDMTTWECRFITDSGAPDHVLAWGRRMLRNYRPDEIFEPDYRWRYVKVVKTDVMYKHSDPDVPSLEFFQNCLKGCGVCGRRAFFGRFMLRCFGIPTWGVTQRGHAAISHWTPEGWVTNFGAHWRWNWWRGRRGEDFLLESQAREHPNDYAKVLRAQWVGCALGEAKVDGMTFGTGGLWNALALNQKRAIVAEAKPVEVARAGEDLAEANVSTKAEKILKAKITDADKEILVTRAGIIAIPAVACSSPKNNTAKIVFMKSFLGGMQLHYSRLGKPETFEYTIDVPTAGKYTVVARIVTVQSDQHLYLTANDEKTPIDIALPYTIGMWAETAPVEVSLVQGKNVLHFTGKDPNFGVSIEGFTLTPVK